MREATPTVLQANSRLERGADTTLTRSPVQVARRPLPGVLNLGGPGAQTIAARPTGRREEGNGVSQAGQAFADLLLVGSTASRCPLALLTVMRGEGWSTLSFGAERDALEDPELFSIIAGRREPVEVTDPGSNPALAHSRLARSNLGIRWLLAIPLFGPQRRRQRHLLGTGHRAPGAFPSGAGGHGGHRPPRERCAVCSPGHR